MTAISKQPGGKIPVLLNWSGGKDAAYSLYRLQQEGLYEVRYLLTVFNQDGRSSMHEIPEPLIAAQALHTGIPLLKIYVSDAAGRSYDAAMAQVLEQVKQEGIQLVAFGDLFLDDLRQYREKQLQQAGMTAIFPLWQIDAGTYLQQFFQSGFEAVICCVNGSMLDKTYCGKPLSPALIASFPAPADPCGENGEYHSFCYAGPVFSSPVPYHAEGWFNRFFPSPVNEQEQVCFRHLKFRDE
ncbi:ATP-binding protein [Niabella sp.]|uniref:Dph6-related ATP pyrophosphatase n=1 Tax=Niabella sp. TaxID=1962976 RepID=UPI00263366CD|nr:ATP-binding protein [Niabella sp.]